MTPEEKKARELVEKLCKNAYQNADEGLTHEQAKQCALICVEEIQSYPNNEFIAKGSVTYKYWQKVKQSIIEL